MIPVRKLPRTSFAALFACWIVVAVFALSAALIFTGTAAGAGATDSATRLHVYEVATTQIIDALNIDRTGAVGRDDSILTPIDFSARSGARGTEDTPATEARLATSTPSGTGAMAGQRFGHTFTKHGSANTQQLEKEAAGSARPVGQFLDDAAAERFIADHLGELAQGARTFPAPPGLGRIVNPDGTFSPATRVRLVPSGSGVKTAYPEP